MPANGMKRVGVTAWIKSTVLNGVAFDRRGCPGQGSASKGLALGRRVDAAFKHLCQTGAVPGDASVGVKRRTRVIAAALRRAGVELTGANVFVTRGQLKTHLDGTGTAGGQTVVLELKCTQASLENHAAAYDVPCSAQPAVTIGGVKLPNTERSHHQLQLAFGVLASGSSTGFVVVSASNGARLYRHNTGLPPSVFSVPPVVTVAAGRPTKRRRAPAKPRGVVPWPGAAVAVPGWHDHGSLTKGVVLVRNARGAVAAAVAAASASKAAMAVVRRAAVEAKVRVGLVCVPSGGKWKCYKMGTAYMRDGKP